jgi:hypothetical protein
MKILLSDASGLTSRQLATILSRAGHKVHALSPPGSVLTRLTRHVSKIHLVPPFGYDPYIWLDRALAIIASSKQSGEAFDVLICSQEQVTVISAEVERVRETGIYVAVPEFQSLRKVMDKITACSTLAEYGLSQPESMVLSSLFLDDLVKLEGRQDFFPAYVKFPIATGSTGVWRVLSISDLCAVAKKWKVFDHAEEKGKLLLQKEVKGPLLMICGIFSHGKLVAWHACLRAREGVSGGASKKVSCPLPIVERDLEKLGIGLGWHGALSADAILVDKGEEKELLFIDINPRIVEPMNGLLAGVDLVGALLDISRGSDGSETENEVKKRMIGEEGMQTHQLVLALLGAAKEGRFSLVKEVWMAVRGWDGYYGYKGSVEELTPIRGDWRSIFVLLGLAVLLFVGGRWMQERLSGGTIQNYAVSPEGWEEICRMQDRKEIQAVER